MSNEHWYYLHTNGELIHKSLRPDPSDFVVHIWSLDVNSRLDVWRILIEAIAAGANINRIKELAQLWKCTLEDFPEYLLKETPTPERFEGMKRFSEAVFQMDLEVIFHYLEELPKGVKLDMTTLVRAS